LEQLSAIAVPGTAFRCVAAAHRGEVAAVIHLLIGTRAQLIKWRP